MQATRSTSNARSVSGVRLHGQQACRSLKALGLLTYSAPIVCRLWKLDNWLPITERERNDVSGLRAVRCSVVRCCQQSEGVMLVNLKYECVMFHAHVRFNKRFAMVPFVTADNINRAPFVSENFLRVALNSSKREAV